MKNPHKKIFYNSSFPPISGLLKKINFIFLFFIFSNICAANNADLLSHWTLDESSGLVASDSRGNNPGTLIDAQIWKPTNGQFGGALRFDGINDLIDLGVLDVSGSKMSISFWFKADDFDTDDARFISKATGTSGSDHYWMVSTINQSKLRFRLKTNGDTTTLISPAGTISSGQWHHVTATYDGTEMKIYRDGELVASTAKTGNIDTNNSVPAAIGNQPVNAGQKPFHGLMDDVRIYTAALTVDQIQTVIESDPNPFLLESNLLSHWTLDESSGLVASDSMGNNPGTLIDAQIWKPTKGQFGGALRFDGIRDLIDLGVLDVSGNKMSISFWFKADDFNKPDARFISKAASLRSKEHYWMVGTINQSKLRFMLKTKGVTTTLISPLDTISSKQWHHVAAIYDGKKMRIYRDGELVASTAKKGNINTDNSVSVAIGNQPVNAGKKPFHGLMDDVRIYTRALTVDQIQVVIANTPINEPPIAVAGNDQTIILNNAENSSSVVLDGQASYDNDGSITQFEWRNQDNVLLGNSAIITASLPLGVHLINLTVTDNEGASDTDSVTMDIQSENDTPPTVSIISPTNAATISSTITISADATDDNSITGVQFQVDGVNFGNEDTTASYSIAFDSTTIADGSHTITAIATDSANQTTSTSIDITVSNASLPPLACSDGIDNDGDGLVDYPEDLGCISLNDNSEVDSAEDGSWTTFTPSADTRIVYVSDSTGNDSACVSYPANQINDPFHPASSFISCQTISTAVAIFNDLPNNEPHWILFKSGDTWTNQSFGKWERSGRSAAEPTLLASYGDSSERPKVLTGTSSFSGSVSNGVKYVTLADLFIHAHTSDASTGKKAFRWITSIPSGDWVFEGLYVKGYEIAFLMGASQDPYQGKITNLTFRNNTIHRNKGENALYISGINGLKVFEGNTFYLNGYLDTLTEGEYRGKHLYFDNENGYFPADPTGHSIYKNNFFVDSSAYGFHARTGGEIANNYVESHGIGFSVGNHDGGQTWPIVPVSIHDNVVMHLADSLHQTLGYGIDLENVDADVEHNIIAYYGSALPYGHPFYITGNGGNTTQVRMTNNTIYSTIGDIRGAGDVAPIVETNNLVNDDMDLLATNIRSSTVNFVDADPVGFRDLAKYNMEILGGARDVDAFMAEALKQWRGYFRAEYTVTEVNDYIRRGFEPDGSQPEMCDKGAVPCGFGAAVSSIAGLPPSSAGSDITPGITTPMLGVILAVLILTLLLFRFVLQPQKLQKRN